ncbi:uncharacterized protein [Amphiura filiformis]|uniref:uncharacterized protein n=1 Tax=Amphiura filiformis TaxID=82378 RepID=UPI003B21D2DC
MLSIKMAEKSGGPNSRMETSDRDASREKPVEKENYASSFSTSDLFSCSKCKCSLLLPQVELKQRHGECIVIRKATLIQKTTLYLDTVTKKYVHSKPTGYDVSRLFGPLYFCEKCLRVIKEANLLVERMQAHTPGKEANLVVERKQVHTPGKEANLVVERKQVHTPGKEANLVVERKQVHTPGKEANLVVERKQVHTPGKEANLVVERKQVHTPGKEANLVVERKQVHTPGKEANLVVERKQVHTPGKEANLVVERKQVHTPGKEANLVLERKQVHTPGKEANLVVERKQVHTPGKEANLVVERKQVHTPRKETNLVVERKQVHTPGKEANLVVERKQVHTPGKEANLVVERKQVHTPGKEANLVVERKQVHTPRKETNLVVERKQVHTPGKEANLVVERKQVHTPGKEANLVVERKQVHTPGKEANLVVERKQVHTPGKEANLVVERKQVHTPGKEANLVVERKQVHTPGVFVIPAALSAFSAMHKVVYKKPEPPVLLASVSDIQKLATTSSGSRPQPAKKGKPTTYKMTNKTPIEHQGIEITPSELTGLSGTQPVAHNGTVESLVKGKRSKKRKNVNLPECEEVQGVSKVKIKTTSSSLFKDHDYIPVMQQIIKEKGTDKTNKARQPKWEEEEVLILVACVKDKTGELFGSAGSAGVEVKKRKAWKEISEVLGSAGYSRTWEVVRKKWADMAFRAKQYRRNRIGANVTGGGKQPVENKGLEAVLNALPDEVTEGVVPVGTCETIPQIETPAEDQDIDNKKIGKKKKTSLLEDPDYVPSYMYKTGKGRITKVKKKNKTSGQPASIKRHIDCEDVHGVKRARLGTSDEPEKQNKMIMQQKSKVVCCCCARKTRFHEPLACTKNVRLFKEQLNIAIPISMIREKLPLCNRCCSAMKDMSEEEKYLYKLKTRFWNAKDKFANVEQKEAMKRFELDLKEKSTKCSVNTGSVSTVAKDETGTNLLTKHDVCDSHNDTLMRPSDALQSTVKVTSKGHDVDDKQSDVAKGKETQQVDALLSDVEHMLSKYGKVEDSLSDDTDEIRIVEGERLKLLGVSERDEMGVILQGDETRNASATNQDDSSVAMVNLPSTSTLDNTSVKGGTTKPVVNKVNGSTNRIKTCYHCKRVQKQQCVPRIFSPNCRIPLIYMLKNCLNIDACLLLLTKKSIMIWFSAAIHVIIS